jgi:hypothetical protein
MIMASWPQLPCGQEVLSSSFLSFMVRAMLNSPSPALGKDQVNMPTGTLGLTGHRSVA